MFKRDSIGKFTYWWRKPSVSSTEHLKESRINLLGCVENSYFPGLLLQIQVCFIWYWERDSITLMLLVRKGTLRIRLFVSPLKYSWSYLWYEGKMSMLGQGLTSWIFLLHSLRPSGKNMPYHTYVSFISDLCFVYQGRYGRYISRVG